MGRVKKKKDSHKLLDIPVIERCLGMLNLKEADHQTGDPTTLRLPYFKEVQTIGVQRLC